MRTIIDGYNLVWALPPLRDLMKAKQSGHARLGLVRLAGRLVRAGKLKPPVTIVFDGRPKAGTAAGALEAGVDVRFAPHPDDADRLIADMVEHGAVADEFMVVTSDRELQARVRRFGAKVMRVKEFIEEHVPERKRREVAPSDDDVKASEKPQGKLPDFMVKEWLEEFGLDDE